MKREREVAAIKSLMRADDPCGLRQALEFARETLHTCAPENRGRDELSTACSIESSCNPRSENRCAPSGSARHVTVPANIARLLNAWMTCAQADLVDGLMMTTTT